MTDEPTISAGGAVAVDTDELEAAALRLDDAASGLATAADEATSAALRAGGADGALLLYGQGRTAAEALEASAAAARDLARALRQAAATYAMVELRLTRDAAVVAGDDAAALRAQGGMDALAQEWPGAVAAADEALDRAGRVGGTAVAQLAWGGLIAGPAGLGVFGLGLLPVFAAGVAAIRARGTGTVGAGRAVVPGGSAATLDPLFTSQRVVAPGSLAAAAARIPASGAARVRVEQYRYPDGARAFAVYVAGTRSLGGSDPWDMTSNVGSFTGRRSDALATVEDALTQAGARPGDRLYAFGHSQGAMIAGQLEQTGVYDVRVLGTLGSPTVVDAGEATLTAQVRHADDPVAALAVGHELRTGGPGGFVVERVVDPPAGVHDLGLPGHHLETYVQTARAADGSADPRVLAFHERLAELAEAEPIEVREYGARR
ncbi:hypothetical protein [Microbacterium caowuchunii]|uniref:Alpha/beta hydrolase n=1 Tax=Microbacterium caowuchunii TaxID=2614638 RepID=A0A5N0TH89_9MICO|nr:hypothetical protein [Microbacterium caowuchunii]KAA9134450.1 hypothetical protein F6B40_06700 [Microbacterium caowuchunii]